jgi:hypothetical protein
MADLALGSGRDALHILPLSMVPLATPGLRRAHLLKNVHLEGVLELFYDPATGSGQIDPEQLPLVFDFSGDRAGDLDIIKRLSVLPSYDVYSLRVNLKRLGISGDSDKNLQLSHEMAEELATHMRRFTQPLIAAIYGEKGSQDVSFADVLTLFADPNVGGARKNLKRLAQTLEIDLREIPQFLADYADVYMSLSYYRQCLVELGPILGKLLAALKNLKLERDMQAESAIMRAIEETETKLRTIYQQAGNVVDMFEATTDDMWKDLTSARYKKIKKMILGLQTTMGAGLCALSVKAQAWNTKFPTPISGSVADRARYVMRDMSYGLDKVKSVTYPDI